MYDYSRDYPRRGRGRSSRRGPSWRGRRARGGTPRRYAGYGAQYGYGPEMYAAPYAYEAEPYGYGAELYGYGREYEDFGGRARWPGKPARGYPVRGIHTYDLDYGNLAGPTTDYSGRAGYPEDRDWEDVPRGTYTPRLAEIGREARRRRRLYGAVEPTYSGPGRRGRRWR
jgi:hypothetical protein